MKIAFMPGGRPDGIFSALQGEMRHHGFQEVSVNDAEVVMISAGDPFWAKPGHIWHDLERLIRTQRRVVVVERHEYGWPNYAARENREHTAHLGVDDYGLNIEAGGFRPHREGWHVPLGRLVREIDKRNLIYMRREFYTDFDYPDWVAPTNFQINPPPAKFTFEHFTTRPLDVMCVWGETHPHRKDIADALKKAVADGLITGDIRSPVYNGDPGRLPGGDGYRRPHERARIFITADGHGLGGGREWELITTSVMFRKRSWMQFPHDFTDAESCVLFGQPNDPKPEELVEKIVAMKNDHEALYRIYSAGYDLAVQHHTIRARALDVIGFMDRKGWR